MKILTIETTCDETAATVVTDRLEVHASVVASQDASHRRFGRLAGAARPELLGGSLIVEAASGVPESRRDKGVAIEPCPGVQSGRFLQILKCSQVAGHGCTVTAINRATISITSHRPWRHIAHERKIRTFI